jgi:hypothetical protein
MPPSTSADCGDGLVSFLAIGNETVVVEKVRNIQTIGNPNGSVLTGRTPMQCKGT